jgi:hypothetical protein
MVLQLACRGGGRGDFLVSIPMVVVLSLEVVSTLEADIVRVGIGILSAVVCCWRGCGDKCGQ